MNEGLIQLLELQNVDKELQVLEDAKDKYPTEINSRQREIELAQKNLEQQEKLMEELSQKQRHFERELEVSKVDLKKHEERFAEVTTNKEYDALQLEIEACKAKISEYETQILQTIEGIENQQETVAAERQNFEEVSKAQQERIDELQQKLSTLQEEVDGVCARRQGYTDGIDANLFQTYERSRKRRGMRVAPIRKGACGGCFTQLPAQQLSDVRHTERVYFCESCGTILVWDDKSG